MLYNKSISLLLKISIVRFHDTCDMLSVIMSDFIIDIQIAVSFMFLI